MMTPLCLALILAGQAPKPDPGSISDAHERTLAEADKTYAAMKPVDYRPPADRWDALPRTKKKLAEGGELRVVMLGDSIVHDTSRSSWDLVLGREYPKVKVKRITAVRGNTGCTYYKDENRVKRFVIDHNPDLVLIGGISHLDNADAVRDVVRQIKARSKADVLLMTGPFGFFDPLDAAQWKTVADTPPESYRAKLEAVAREMKVGFLDIQRIWGDYVRTSGKPLGDFKRDVVHANPEGEQVLGRILVRYFTLDGSHP